MGCLHEPTGRTAACEWLSPLCLPHPAHATRPRAGKNLQAQYERWQPRAKYKMHLDPTVEDVKKLCSTCRKAAKVGTAHGDGTQTCDGMGGFLGMHGKPNAAHAGSPRCVLRPQNERVLFHYNGHGVPRPTVNGEIWVFNSRYTQYIPLSIYELQSWLGTPSIYVLDCSAAGLIINAFRALMDQRQQDMRMVCKAADCWRLRGGRRSGRGAGLSSCLSLFSPSLRPALNPPASCTLQGLPPGSAPGASNGAAGAADPLKEVIVIAACGANEVLPQNAELPADVFTACLTTPIKVSRAGGHRQRAPAERLGRLGCSVLGRKLPDPPLPVLLLFVLRFVRLPCGGFAPGASCGTTASPRS